MGPNYPHFSPIYKGFSEMYTTCGTPFASGRIVGGTDAAIGTWPWQVVVQSDNYDSCGGTLISDSWVLTSAHCFQMPPNLSANKIYLGVNQLSDMERSGTVIRRPKKIIIHPSYKDEGSSGDIALVEMERPVDFTPMLFPVCLPSHSVNVPEGTLCWATGWGYIKHKVPLPNPKTLQEVQVALIRSQTCESLYQKSLGYDPNGRLIQEDMLCAGYIDGQRDTCQGDSGGPLVCNVEGTWMQMGVISWGLGCAEPSHPGVYTSVQYYLSWIEGNVTPSQKKDKLESSHLVQNSNIPKYYFKYQPPNSSRSYLLSEQNYTESRNLTSNGTALKAADVVGNGGHSSLCSMANALWLLLGLGLLLF
ncbi:serine protease 33-like [Engystomops pustulosus]|uniref:serine protease 33-like n=1 Tax=Engystomops pustulosus TaxID=76066 RepID=UPI003AFAF3F0